MTASIARPAAVALAALAAAWAGCGGTGLAAHEPAPPAAAPAREQSPNVERMRDLVPLTTAQAARAAKRVAVVVSHGSRVVEGAPGTPFTRTRFAVEKVLKGRLPRRFVLQVIGGRLGNVTVDSLVPAFARSHRYVLFLGPDGPVGPTIFPQSVIPVKAGRLDHILTGLRRYL